MNTIDARTLNQQTQYELRKQVVRLRKKGLDNQAISEIVGLCKSHVSTICKKYERGGLDAIKPGLRGRRHGAQRELTAEQEVGIQKLLVDKTPDQLKLSFSLWTRDAVRLAIKQIYGRDLPLRTISDYLKRWGFTPQKPSDPSIELIDKRQVLVPLEDGDFINADLGHTLKTSVGKAVINDKLDGPEHRIPTGFEDIGRFFPGQPLRPAGQIDLIGKGHPFLAVTPRQGFDFDAMLRAFNPARRIAKIDLERPNRNIFKQPLRLPVKNGASFSALRTNRPAVAARNDVNNQGFRTANECDAGSTVNERLETFDFVQ